MMHINNSSLFAQRQIKGLQTASNGSDCTMVDADYSRSPKVTKMKRVTTGPPLNTLPQPFSQNLTAYSDNSGISH